MTDTNSVLRDLRAREARARGIAPDARTPARDLSALYAEIRPRPFHRPWTLKRAGIWSCAIALALTAGYWLGSAVK